MDRALTDRQGKKRIIRVIAFIAILAVLYGAMNAVFSNDPDFRIAQTIGSFYDEPVGSLQGVYIGSSNCYAYWNSMAAWREYGLNVFPYSCPTLPFYATEYVIREARKTQPDAVYIVNVNSVDEDDLYIHDLYHLLSYMPASENKAKLRNRLCDLLGLKWWERLELYFPWIRMHQYWEEYFQGGVIPHKEGMKGASHYGIYLTQRYDLSRRFRVGDTREPLPEELTASINSLLDYCDAENVKVVFVTVPQAEKTQKLVGRINTTCDLIRERGYEVLYLANQVDAMGMDMTQDFYGYKHTNIHGSIKFTSYVSKHLISEYGMEDRRGQAGYESWDAGWERYQRVVAPYVLDFELDAAHRDNGLKAPVGVNAAREGEALTVRWKASNGADAYCVYRKAGEDGAWQRIAETDACEYADADYQDDIDYRYTVVPVRHSGEEAFFGNFFHDGKRVTQETSPAA